MELLIWLGSVPVRGWSGFGNGSYISRAPTLRKRSQTDELMKMILSFGAIISATFFRNGGNTYKGSTPTDISRSRSRRRRTEVRKVK